MPSPLCIGHRGATGHLPENTLPSFERAIDLGCDWVELDVYAIEEELLVIHDKRVDRTTNGSGYLKDLSLTYLRSLDAGGGAQIPTLREVLDLIAGRCRVNVELKGEGTAAPVSELLDYYCHHGWHIEDFLISSFSHRLLAEFDERYRRGALFAKLLPDQWQRAEKLGAWSVNFDQKDISTSLVAEAHARGYKVLTYTPNTYKDIQRVIDCGVDGIFSDFPDRVLSARNAAG
jgi:glycerophosphoryl diester phosphodiesterase